MTALERPERRCGATARSGERCGNYPMRGAAVCRMHGGSAPRARTAAARREAERKATAALKRHSATPVDDPLAAFQQLAGEVIALKDWLGAHVETLEQIRYQGGSGEQIRGELQAYSNALESCRRVLSDYGRLNIDERLVRINEQIAHQLVAIIDATWRRIGVEGDTLQTVKAFVAAQLRMLAAADSPALAVEDDLDRRLDAVRLQVTTPERLVAEMREQATQHERELAMVRRELDAVQAERERLRSALAARGPLPPLEIDAAPPSIDVLSGEVPDVEPEPDPEPAKDASPPRPAASGGGMRFYGPPRSGGRGLVIEGGVIDLGPMPPHPGQAS